MTTAETRPETGGTLHLYVDKKENRFLVEVEYNDGLAKPLFEGTYIPGIQTDSQLEWVLQGAALFYGMTYSKEDYWQEIEDDTGAEAESSPTEG